MHEKAGRKRYVLGWKGPFHVWEIESSEEKEAAALAIALLEKGRETEEKRLNEE